MKIEIRPLIESDAYTSVMWRNDLEVFKFTGFKWTRKITIEDELQWIRTVINNSNDLRCAIIADEEYVGNIYLNNINTGIGQYNIFIGNKAYWGKGVAKEASKIIIKKGFDELSLNSITLKVRPENVRALRLYLSLGFKEINRDNEWIEMEIINTALL